MQLELRPLETTWKALVDRASVNVALAPALRELVSVDVATLAGELERELRSAFESWLEDTILVPLSKIVFEWSSSDPAYAYGALFGPDGSCVLGDGAGITVARVTSIAVGVVGTTLWAELQICRIGLALAKALESAVHSATFDMLPRLPRLVFALSIHDTTELEVGAITGPARQPDAPKGELARLRRDFKTHSFASNAAFERAVSVLEAVDVSSLAKDVAEPIVAAIDELPRDATFEAVQLSWSSRTRTASLRASSLGIIHEAKTRVPVAAVIASDAGELGKDEVITLDFLRSIKLAQVMCVALDRPELAAALAALRTPAAFRMSVRNAEMGAPVFFYRREADR